jgi:hypothetical protein
MPQLVKPGKKHVTQSRSHPCHRSGRHSLTLSSPSHPLGDSDTTPLEATVLALSVIFFYFIPLRDALSHIRCDDTGNNRCIASSPSSRTIVDP